MRQYVVPLFAANGVAFAAVGVSYLLYSRLLTPQEFGAYSAALAVGTFATLVLDGGMRASIIKDARSLTRLELGALATLMFGFSVVIVAALISGLGLIEGRFPDVAGNARFVMMFAAVYLLSYPWIGLPTAQLERSLAYTKIAWIEGVGIVLERGAPVLFLYFTDWGLYAFVAGLAVGRLFRVAALARFEPIAPSLRIREAFGSLRRLVREGIWYQVGGAASLVRDNLHVILVGPLFGAAWVGYYAWGLQLCLIASQIFVQISARVTLPLAAQAPDHASRRDTVLRQIGLLSAMTGPILAAVILVAPALDLTLFEGKWAASLVLLPWLCARMVAGMACTPIAPLLLVESGGRPYAFALWAWTAIEVGAAWLAIKALGPVGLAVSYALTVWPGALVLVASMRRDTGQFVKDIGVAIFRRHGIWLAVAFAAAFLLLPETGAAASIASSLPVALAAAAVVVILAGLADRDVRRLFRRGLR